ncbi:MAG: ethanolamine ammonia-lyase subunit EutC [Panacagrimonas sp.]
MNQDRPLVAAAAGVSEPSPAWAEVSRLTAARVALGRSGVSLPTREVLNFSLAHARARDSVHIPLDVPRLRQELEQDGWPVLEVSTQAPDRRAYLVRPDWGRRLDESSRERLAPLADGEASFDLVFVLSDGLSPVALHNHASKLLGLLKPMLAYLCVAPLVIATQARVALADEIGERLQARLAISVIGERPGLSSPDSLGIYLTVDPKVGRTDAERNCISNIHGAGLAPASAAAQLAELIRLALSACRSGIGLAQASDSLPLEEKTLVQK